MRWVALLAALACAGCGFRAVGTPTFQEQVAARLPPGARSGAVVGTNFIPGYHINMHGHPQSNIAEQIFSVGEDGFYFAHQNQSPRYSSYPFAAITSVRIPPERLGTIIELTAVRPNGMRAVENFQVNDDGVASTTVAQKNQAFFERLEAARRAYRSRNVDGAPSVNPALLPRS